MSHLCPHCNSFLTFGGSQEGKSTQLGCVRGVRNMDRNTVGSNRTGFWSYKQVLVLIRTRCSKHMQYFRALRKLDQCVEVVGKSARRWRRLLTEYCEGPGQGEQKRSRGQLA